MGEFICFVVLFALAIILLIVFFDMEKSENGMVENTTVKKAINDKEDVNDKEDTTVKKEYVDIKNADFKTQLSSLVLTKEETEMRQEQQRQAALEEKERQERLREIAYQEEVRKAERAAENYLKAAQMKILQQAQKEKYGIGDQIVVDIPAPSHIQLYCRVENLKWHLLPNDGQWYRLFTDALKKKATNDNISFVAMGRPVSQFLGHKNYYLFDYAPHPSIVEVYGTFTCRYSAERDVGCFFRFTCTVVDNSKEEAVLTNEEDLSSFQNEPENKKMRAEAEAEKFSDVVKREILKKAKAHKYERGDKIIVDVPAPKHIELKISCDWCSFKDEEWCKSFIRVLKEMKAEHISCVLMAKVERENGTVYEKAVPGVLPGAQESDSPAVFFRCTCTIAKG